MSSKRTPVPLSKPLCVRRSPMSPLGCAVKSTKPNLNAGSCVSASLSSIKNLLRTFAHIFRRKAKLVGETGDIAVLALLKPLFEPQLFTEIMRDTPGRKNPRCARIARIGALLSRGDWPAPWSLPARPGTPPGVRLMEGPLDYSPDAGTDFSQRLLAMLMPVMFPRDLLPVFRRWCAPIKTNPTNP